MLDGRRQEGLIKHYQESVEICRELGDKRRAATFLHHLGSIIRHQGQGFPSGRVPGASQGEGGQPAALFAESLDLYTELGEKRGIANCLVGLAGLALSNSQPERAARLFGAATALLADVAIQLPPLDRAEYERDLTAARQMLDEATWDTMWAEGAAAPLEALRDAR